MSKLAALQALAAQAAATGPDMTEAQKGGTSRLLPTGYAFGRLVEYIELGKQPQEYQGQSKDPAPEIKIAFALWGQGYQNDDGTPYIIRPYSMAFLPSEKNRAFKLLKLLNWAGTATHFAQLLGQGFLVKIVHEAKSKTDATIVSRIDLTGFLPPTDPVTKAPYAIPEAPDDLLNLFLWDYPTKEAWDALYVDGKWDDGRSKNSVQETILSALDFPGSPLEQLLLSTGAMAALPQGLLGSPAPAALALPTAPTPAVAPTAAPAPLAVPQVAAPLVVPAAASAVAVPQSPVPVIPTAPVPPVGMPLMPTSPSNPS